MEPILDRWSAPASIAGRTWVVPDGCRDLICKVTDMGPQWLVSDLFDAAMQVPTGCTTFGWRLRAGAVIDGRLGKEVGSLDPGDPGVERALNGLVTVPRRVTEALNAIQAHTTVADAAAELGVSVRTLQRLVSSKSGRRPGYWLQLARARRCARALTNDAALGDVAFMHGYADQAHMTRDFRRWFGTTPGRFRADSSLVALVQAQGFGDR